MEDISKAIRVGAFFVIGCALLWITYETFSESNWYSEDGYEVEAKFANLKQLKLGSDVRMAGVSIGSVAEMGLSGREAVAKLLIEKSIVIPKDSRATITTAGLLGTNYVSIDAGISKRYMTDGDSIQTYTLDDVNSIVAKIGDVGDKVSNFMDGMTGSETGSPFAPINNMVEKMEPKLDQVLDNMLTVSERLVNAEGALGKLISKNEMYDRLLAMTDDIKVAAEDARAMFADVRKLVGSAEESEGPLQLLLHNKEYAAKLELTMQNVYEFSEKLNSDDSSLGRFLSDDEMYARAQNVINKVERAVDSVDNSGPITAVGIVSGSLF